MRPESWARWLAVSLLGLASAGCTSTVAGTPASVPPPPPLPPAVRAPVTWADTLCTTVKEMDGLRKEIDLVNQNAGTPAADSYARSYVMRISQSVAGMVKDLKEVKPAGIKAADGFGAELTKVLGTLAAKLPSTDDPATMTNPDFQKAAKAQEIAAVIAAVEPQRPKLAGLARAVPELGVSYNLAPACEPVPLFGVLAPATPARALVSWSDTLCQSARTLSGLQTNPLDDVASGDPRFAQFAGIELGQYLRSAASQVDQLTQQLAPLPPTGVKEADDYRASLLTALRAAAGKIPPAPGLGQSYDTPVDELKPAVAQVAGVFAELKPRGAQLAPIAARSPVLMAAYGLSPHCEPPAPMPVARNGTDVAACQSGQCQIQVTGKVDVTVSGLKFSVVVTGDGVTITDDSARLRMGAGGGGAVGKDGKTVHFHVAGLTATAAVLDISTS
ncbi:hypothetical protein [Amycolatopsis sp. H20-H5]|uniref:hypothetical protein n=1 Tax=Amycolatopsis sp. H20-H5 TaxID=3046309 RepID=UPI002DBB6E4D|nr:hypothetical protein [Amycolatopsis sp. H20-H5]MEC3975921.1 hypothetical protein [Amycolatopsis sp. H20-H5]